MKFQVDSHDCPCIIYRDYKGHSFFHIITLPKSGPQIMLPAKEATTQEIHADTGWLQAKFLPASLRTAKTQRIM